MGLALATLNSVHEHGDSLLSKLSNLLDKPKSVRTYRL